MRAKLLRDGPERVFALVFDVDDEAIGTLAAFAEDAEIGGARFTARVDPESTLPLLDPGR